MSSKLVIDEPTWTLTSLIFSLSSYDASNPTSGIGRYANDKWTKPINSKVVCIKIDGMPHLFLRSLSVISPFGEIMYDYGDSSAPWR